MGNHRLYSVSPKKNKSKDRVLRADFYIYDIDYSFLSLGFPYYIDNIFGGLKCVALKD
jgi:hypothetical protein